MGAHLHAVPDPEPYEAPRVGEWPAPIAIVSSPPADDEPLDDAHPAIEDGGRDDDQDDADDEEPDDEIAEDEEPRCGLIAGLQPYYDVRPLAELGPLAVEATKAAGPPLRRGLGRILRELPQMLAWYGRGIRVLLVLIVGWLSGKYGERGSLGARFVGAGFVVYAVVKLCDEYQHAWMVATLAILSTMAMAATGRIQIPAGKPAKKGEGGAKKGATEKGKEEVARATAETTKEAASEAPRKGLMARLLGRAAAPAKEASVEEAPVAPEVGDGEPQEEGTEEGAEEAGEDPETGGEETPQEDPLTALLRASIGSENGVHLSTLRPLMRKHLPGLSQATNEELRNHLTAAGYDPSRKFRALGVAGRSGVHRTELPPLPSPEGGPGALSGPLSTPGECPRPANSPAAGEERRAAGEVSERWTAEQKARGFRSVPDPANGPSASRIEHYDGR
ncbi:hypothetical protein ACIQZO_35060 [Streptomyces sp. NPDC097617]|uniref:hypothetical protein n=1 Tax=Streptomyces sp. NPDC097617 TaxID=3366091 RepID=UPI003810B589